MVKRHLVSLRHGFSIFPGDAQKLLSLHFRSEYIIVRRRQQPVDAPLPHHAAFQPHGIQQGTLIRNSGKLQRFQPPVIVCVAGQRHRRRRRFHAVNHVIQLLHPEVAYLFIRLPRSKRFQHPAFRIRQKRAIFKIPDVAAPHFQHELHARGVLEGNQPHHALPASRAGDQACSRPAPETAEGADQKIYQPGGTTGHGIQVGASGQPRGQLPGRKTEPLQYLFCHIPHHESREGQKTSTRLKGFSEMHPGPQPPAIGQSPTEPSDNGPPDKCSGKGGPSRGRSSP